MRRLLFFYTVIIIYWLSVVFTCDDWGNRFFITLTPFFIIMGLGLLLNKNSSQID
jgi:FtsH-binding integral membrane protein